MAVNPNCNMSHKPTPRTSSPPIVVSATPAEDQRTPDRLSALMKAAQAGDKDAYAQLIREILPTLRRIVTGHRGFLPTPDIEDLVQDILLSLHSVRNTYDSRRPFNPWLRTIVRNRLADGARRFARRGRLETGIDETGVTFSLEYPNNSTAAVYGDPEALRRAINRLPKAQRSAIEMLKLRELSLKEAVAASGMSLGALKTATHRAMATLRKLLVHEPKY